MKNMRFVYPSDLPISAARQRIEAAIRSSQVVVVQGQTGSGKTTQIPKMLLEMGRGTHGRRIAHTQPRRLAARTVAERLCEETGTRLGDEIGYQVRFTDQTSPSSRLIIMTDGILLAQIQRDPTLSRYDTIVIDEAHERSLNIDFLLGYLTELLPKRPDLKLIITSATIDAEKFREHFAQALHRPVPVIEVSGRTYPVKIVYEPAGMPPALTLSGGTGTREEAEEAQEGDDGDVDMPSQVARACTELITLSAHETGPRDILVFASGERDIRDFAAAIRRALPPSSADPRSPRYIEILPLYARLSNAEQHRVFDRHPHQRIVIATNVAETSLTVPGIRYVVDPGTARISRYSKSAKVQRLPIEPISQASANQRAGRTGRVADGICIRLYSKQDFDSRPEFTDPEILRTSLGAVILHMLSAGVAHSADDVEDFGFIDKPDRRSVTDGITELNELGAISRHQGRMVLTRLGRQLSRLPIDVRLGRMIIQAHDTSTPDVLACILVIVSFLSLQDPRERPEDKREEADRLHNRYADPTSDFLTVLNIWNAFYGQQVSGHQMRRRCTEEFFSFLRMRAWNDLYRQLVQVCRELRFPVSSPRPGKGPEAAALALPAARQAAGSLACSWDGESIHRCMLSGLLSNIGMQVIVEPKASHFAGLKGAARARAMKRAARMSRNTYQGAHGTRFALFPASSLFRTTPPWVMAADLTETSRLWARMAAQIDPAWCEPLAGSLTKTTYSAPHWSASAGAAIATSHVLLYGLPIVSDRKVQWGRINPAEARDLLIRQGLVEGQVSRRFPYDDFLERNRETIASGQEDVNRTRQMTETANDEDLVQFYESRIPQSVTTVADLAKWLRSVHAAQPHVLDFDPARDVDRLDGTPAYHAGDYPSVWKTTGTDGSPIDLALSYTFHPGQKDDGVSVHIPLRYLNRLRPEEFGWLVPGMRQDLVTGMIKTLPKQLRVQFVPAPQSAARIVDWIARMGDPSRVPGVNRIPADHPSEPFSELFTRAAIATVGAQIHPDDFDAARLARLPGYLRMTFVIERDDPRHDNARERAAALSGASLDENRAAGETGQGPEGPGAPSPTAHPVPIASFGQGVSSSVGQSLDRSAAVDDEDATDSGNGRDRQNRRGGHRHRHGGVRPAATLEVLATGKDLAQLQRDLAEQAEKAARKAIGHSAHRAKAQGNVVASATMLHRAGATTKPREDLLWDAALGKLRLPSGRISSRWLGREALVLSGAPYKTTKELTDDLQMAAVKRLLPNIHTLATDEELDSAVAGCLDSFEDTVYAVAHDVIGILQEDGKVLNAVSGPATLPMLATLQSIKEHAASLVHPGFIARTSPEALPELVRYLKADEMRLNKAKMDKNRDVKWAWEAKEAQDIVESCRKAVEATPAGEARDAAHRRFVQVRWLYEEFLVSLWGQELGVKNHPSLQRLRRLAAAH